MRTLNDQPIGERDEGAILVWVALSLVVLLGIGALVIDIGRLYVERRELQNGADAAALAVAQDCAEGDCEDDVGTAKIYADLNANDGASTIEAGTPCGSGNGVGLPACADDAPSGMSGATGWVRVATSTLTSGGDDEVSFLLAPLISALTGKTVTASAAAAWGPLGGGPVTPLVFSQCEWEALGGSIGAGTFPSGVRSIKFQDPFSPGNNDPESCTLQAGQDLPGGFGRVDAINCDADFTQGGIATVDPGVDLARDCPLEEWRDNQVLIAIYGPVGGEPGVSGTGNNGQYRIAGFTGLTVRGYRFVRPRGGGRQQWYSSGFDSVCDPGAPGNSVQFICGEFGEYVSDGGEFGTGPDFGARVVKMVE